MNILEYMSEVERTCPQLFDFFTDQLHMAVGISTEAGELLDIYKKRLAYGKNLDKVNVGEELGDILWYLVNLCRMLGLNPEEIMDANIKKLRIRYPVEFTEKSALFRMLDDERASLENDIKSEGE